VRFQGGLPRRREREKERKKEKMREELRFSGGERRKRKRKRNIFWTKIYFHMNQSPTEIAISFKLLNKNSR